MTNRAIRARFDDAVLTAQLRDVPAARDLGYYAPSGDLVLYYGDVGYFLGIVRLGRIEGAWTPCADRPATSLPLSSPPDAGARVLVTGTRKELRDLIGPGFQGCMRVPAGPVGGVGHGSEGRGDCSWL